MEFRRTAMVSPALARHAPSAPDPDRWRRRSPIDAAGGRRPRCGSPPL